MRGDSSVRNVVKSRTPRVFASKSLSLFFKETLVAINDAPLTHMGIFLLIACQLQHSPAFLSFLLVGLLDVLKLSCPTLATHQLGPSDGQSHPLGESFAT